MCLRCCIAALSNVDDVASLAAKSALRLAKSFSHRFFLSAALALFVVEIKVRGVGMARRPGRAEQSRAEQSRAELSRAGTKR